MVWQALLFIIIIIIIIAFLWLFNDTSTMQLI
jgi:hypothetical protein